MIGRLIKRTTYKFAGDSIEEIDNGYNKAGLDTVFWFICPQLSEQHLERERIKGLGMKILLTGVKKP